MSEIKLLPCPFCGGKARISCDTEATRDSEGRLWAYTIVCDSCCATSGLSYSPERAKKAWNTRKPIDDMVEQLESNVIKSEGGLFFMATRGIGFVSKNKAIEIVRGGRE